MAKMIRVKILVSFNGMVIGDEAETEDTKLMRSYMDAGLIERIGDGTLPAGPGGDPQVDPGREHERAEGAGAESGEQGEDPLPG